MRIAAEDLSAPDSYLISPDGVVAAKITGGVRVDDLEKLLAQAKQLPAGDRPDGKDWVTFGCSAGVG